MMDLNRSTRLLKEIEELVNELETVVRNGIVISNHGVDLMKAVTEKLVTVRDVSIVNDCRSRLMSDIAVKWDLSGARVSQIKKRMSEEHDNAGIR